ncbi:hypothetical protein BIZ92_01485 [Achromobacter xylosoxidans]|uniref:Uncharacterized protein n=1 Tax=Alcaligenes xylosoxydans xylosoxydans TaxID=85698 RepID=A0A1R1K0V7_ALCXX|nr:hypothetical protein BIZ92_01485 [Achromobacter xylosoxidans]
MGIFDLIVKPSQNILHGQGLIVLNELDLLFNDRLELTMIETLEEISARILEDLRFNDLNFRNF